VYEPEARRRDTQRIDYVAAMALALVQPWMAISFYVAIALMWFVPDRRIESII
jgi:hypothetical protein